MWLGILLIWRVHFSLTWSLRLKAAIGSKGWNPIENWKYSRIRLYHPPPDRTKVVDISGWMIKPVGPNSSSKFQLYCENNQIRWCRVALLHCVDLCRVSRAWACPGSQLFLYPCQTCPFRWSRLARMKHNHLCLQTGAAVAARESVSQAATPAIRTICAALSAPMFPLAPLKVADITGGLDDISGGFIM